MVLERCCEVAQHRIVLGGQGDEVDRAGRHDLILAPVQVIQGHRHMQCRTDVQADGQAVQLPHDDVFEATPDQLLAALEHLGPYEPGDIVDVEPGATRLNFRELLPDGSAEAILPGFEDHHVDAVGGAVGELGSLPRLKIEPVSLAGLGLGVVQDLLDGNVEGLVAIIGPREALEHSGDRTWVALGDGGLDVDVGEHTPRDDVLKSEGVDDIL